MTQIKIRWCDLGSPTPPGNYRFGPHMVRVTLGDIELANGNPDAEFAIRPDFFSDETPYLLTHVEFPGQHATSRDHTLAAALRWAGPLTPTNTIGIGRVVW
jgi:hypothetical protein